LDKLKAEKVDWLKKEIEKNINKNTSQLQLINIVIKLYEKGYSALDIIDLLDDNNKQNSNFYKHLSEGKKYELLIAFNKIKKEFRNEKLLIMFVLNFLFLDNETNLENISFL
jgi:hypothetical protein